MGRFPDMTIGQAGMWAANNIEPDKDAIRDNPVRAVSARFTCRMRRLLASDLAIFLIRQKNGHMGLQQDVNSKRPFMAGDTCGASGHKFSSGSHAEGRIVGKSALAYILDNPDFKPAIKEKKDDLMAEMYLPSACSSSA